MVVPIETVGEYVQRFVDANILQLHEGRAVLHELEENRTGITRIHRFWHVTPQRREIIQDAIDYVLGKYEGYAAHAFAQHIRDTIQSRTQPPPVHRGSEDIWCPHQNHMGRRQMRFFSRDNEPKPVQTERADI